MRSTRLKISYLRNKISDLLPDENDILGYAGISNILIIESLNESYNLLSLLEAYNEKFETILAKRNVAHLIDNANHYLNEIWNSEQKADRFNDFLNSIAQIRFTLKESYLSLTENTLKLEIEIVQAKEALEELTVDLEEIKHTRTEINLIKTESSEFIQELEQKHKLSIENETRINKFVENIELIDADLKGTSEKINVWKSEVQTIREDITKKQAEFIKIKTEIEQVQENNENNEEILEGLIKTLNEQLELNDKHQDYIKKTIEDVSRAGMAGSFKKRKDELKWIQFFWAVLTIASISGLLILSYTIVKPLIDSQAFELNQLLIKIPVFASAVWLGWFCSKQYGFTSRIMEDYSFKYAISMAFEGYKKETMEIDDDLLHKLVELTIINISKSPVSNFDSKSNHGTPYNEILENMGGKIFKQKNEDK